MTTPNLEQLTKLVDPMTRIYIDAVIDAALRPTIEQLEAVTAERKAWLQKAKARLEQLEAEQRDLWRRYREDDKFVLTRPKIVRLCRELGIE